MKKVVDFVVFLYSYFNCLMYIFCFWMIGSGVYKECGINEVYIDIKIEYLVSGVCYYDGD